ncbi:MAG: hypothetical protein IPM83_03970 [Ignavibacteria bacterium]|nr:hypothetical protein [Ignavibacteria bacterium]
MSVTRHGDMLRIRNAATMSIEFFDARGRSIRTTPITDNDTAIILPRHPVHGVPNPRQRQADISFSDSLSVWPSVTPSVVEGPSSS